MTIPMQAEAEIVAPAQEGDIKFHSVTTILKNVGSDDGLIYWSANMTALAGVKSRKTIDAIMEEQGEAAAIEWLRDARFRAPKGQRTATKLGSAVHAACELYVVEGKRPTMGTSLGAEFGVMDKEVEPYIDSFELFLEVLQPEFTAAEVTVYNTEFGFAGTADGFATVQGTPIILDYKSAKESFDTKGRRKKPRNPVALQLGAYSHAEFAAVWQARRYESYSSRYYLLNDMERVQAAPLPAVEGGIVVHLSPLHCDVYPVRIDQEVFDSFCFAMEAARWEYDISKTVLGAPICLLDNKRDYSN